MKGIIFTVFLFVSTLTLAQHEGHTAAPQQQKQQHQHEQPSTKPAEPAQQHDHSSSMQMDQQTEAPAPSLISQTLHHSGSGTSVEPNSVQVPMWMTRKGKWDLMFHGVVFVNELQQSGPRGYDKSFSTNWFMPMAQRDFGSSRFTVRAMLSLEPATVTNRSYPVLFQLGETAFNQPLVDAQHPHEFVMELAALYDIKLGKNTLLSFYAAPVGEAALGPTAYPHRASAAENPSAALGHHLQDSTHIADDVITVGLTHRAVRIEASGFHGREPDEFRWDINGGPIDSWSTRLTINPAPNWSWQYSVGYLTSPEELHPSHDVVRQTSSLMYNRNFARGSWASTLLWGRNRVIANSPGGHDEVFNSYLAESTLRFKDANHIWTRIESVDRTSELLLGKAPAPVGFHEEFLARIQAYTVGYSREFPLIPKVSSALGAQVTWYGTPQSLKPIYGDHPAGALVFLRFRPKANEQHHH